MMEVASLVMSIIAIIISIVVAIVEGIREQKLNQVNLEAEYFQDIYKEHLIYKIPRARGYIRFNSKNELTGTDKLIEELQSLRKDSLYFQYNNPDFYGKLKDNVQRLENYLVQCGNRIFIGDDQTEVYNNIKKDIEEVYKVISKGYLGKK